MAKKLIKKSITNSEDVIISKTGIPNVIPKAEGSAMIIALRNKIDKKKLGFDIPNWFSFSRVPFDILLKSKKCKGLRFYFALNKVNQLCLVFTGVNEKGGDIYIPIPITRTSKMMQMDTHSSFEDGVGDMGQVCPVYPNMEMIINTLP